MDIVPRLLGNSFLTQLLDYALPGKRRSRIKRNNEEEKGHLHYLHKLIISTGYTEVNLTKLHH